MNDLFQKWIDNDFDFKKTALLVQNNTSEKVNTVGTHCWKTRAELIQLHGEAIANKIIAAKKAAGTAQWMKSPDAPDVEDTLFSPIYAVCDSTLFAVSSQLALIVPGARDVPHVRYPQGDPQP